MAAGVACYGSVENERSCRNVSSRLRQYSLVIRDP